MDSIAAHSTEDALLRLVVEAGQVGSCSQFFLWSRLHLHRFVPHTLCVSLKGQGSSVSVMHVLNAVPMSPELLAMLGDPHAPLWRVLRLAWQRAGREALLQPLADPALRDADPGGALRELGLAQVLVVGVDESEGPMPPVLHHFFGGADSGRSMDLGRQRLLRSLLPCLHFAALRAHPASLQTTDATGEGLVQLTPREREILQTLRQAPRNADVAVQLGISPMTVKNHLRNIMRKLGAANRAQAVGEAMARGLIA